MKKGIMMSTNSYQTVDRCIDALFAIFAIFAIYIVNFVIFPLILPSYSWPYKPTTLHPDIPLPILPGARNYAKRRLCGILHYFLWIYSRAIYSTLMNVKYSQQSSLAQLPFGLILKWSKMSHLDEVMSMKVARRASIPAPRVISYGEHGDGTISILMTRLSGSPLEEIYPHLPQQEQHQVERDLRGFLTTMRGWENPSPYGITTLSGHPVRSYRLPYHQAIPCKNLEEFHQYIQAAIPTKVALGWTEEEWDQFKQWVKDFHGNEFDIHFAHGNLIPENILVDNAGRVTGLLNWETAGFYPEYWEYGTALRNMSMPDYPDWWTDIINSLSDPAYRKSKFIHDDSVAMELTRAKWVL